MSPDDVEVESVRQIIHQKQNGVTTPDNAQGTSTTTSSDPSPNSNEAPQSATPGFWFLDVLTTGADAIAQQFDAIKDYEPPEHGAVHYEANMEKNRYDDVPCLDKTRVVLDEVPPTDDYIHASFVSGSIRTRQFICTQGPLENTATDFWHMIWQNECNTILMLCQTVENNADKCIQYWPIENGRWKRYGPYRIECISRIKQILSKPAFVYVTELEVSKSIGKETGSPLRIQHCQWTNWPDRGIPEHPMVAVKLVQRLLYRPFLKNPKAPPTLLHCSAGIGRSGTIITLERCLGQLIKGGGVDVKETVMSVRAERLGAVQTSSQYLFIHYALLCYADRKRLLGEYAQQSRLTTFARDYDRISRIVVDGRKRRRLKTPAISSTPSNNQDNRRNSERTSSTQRTNNTDKARSKGKAVVGVPDEKQPTRRQKQPVLALPQTSRTKANTTKSDKKGRKKSANSR